MLPDTFWKLELADILRKRRSFTLKFLLPLFLIIPITLPAIPLTLRAGGFTLAIAFAGIFGSAVGLSRLRETRMVERLALLPVPPRHLIIGYILLNSAIDGVQFLIPLLAFVILYPPSLVGLFLIALCFTAALIAANAIGGLVAVAARSSGEGHLIAILVMLGIAGVSGLFSGTQSGGFSPGAIFPFQHLTAVLQMAGTGERGAHAVLAPVSAGLLLVMVTYAGPSLIRIEPGN